MRSFVKWAGGKAQLLNEINDVIDSMREDYDSFIYVEPFAGGGSVLFNVLERCSNLKYAIINDMNTNLITCYKVLRDDVLYPQLKVKLNELQNDYNSCDDKKGFYSQVRDIYNINKKENKIDDVDIASIFIFLNKTCFNGIYRENSKGEFNVPWNQKDYINLYDEDDLNKIHILLKKVMILSGDYHNTNFAMELANVDNCGLIYYMDPPYRPLEGSNSFVSYTKSGFDDKEQIKLKEYCDIINNNGFGVVISNSKSGNFFEDLYNNYIIESVKARRNINSDGEGRGKVDELLIYNKKKKEIGLW